MPITTQNPDPIFVGTPKNWMAAINAANTDSSGAGALVTLVTAGAAEYIRIDEATVVNAQITPVASTAMIIHFFVDRGGTITHVREVPLPAATRTNSTVGATVNTVFTDLILEPNDILKVSQSMHAGAQDLNHVTAFGGVY